VEIISLNYHEVGRWTDFKLSGPLENGQAQFTWDKELEFSIERGYSGTPVFSVVTRNIVGIVSQRDRQKTIGAGRMIPVDRLVAEWNVPNEARRAAAPKTYKHACFISYPPLLDTYAQQKIDEFIKRLETSVRGEMAFITKQDRNIYVDKGRHARGDSFLSDELAVELCQSVCMVIVCMPVYFRDQLDCIREYRTMERLQEERLKQMERALDGVQTDFIIPVVFRGEEDLPPEIKQKHTFASLDPDEQPDLDVFDDHFTAIFKRIARHIDHCCRLTARYPELFEICGQVPIVTESEGRQWQELVVRYDVLPPLRRRID
jgi:hypothetical protein